jgi:hypothetical protein
MNEKFFCRECDIFLTEDPVRETENDPYGTGDYWYSVTQYICPTCKLDEIEERVPCGDCGERMPLDGYDECLKCIVENKQGWYDSEAIEEAKRQ